MVIEKQLLDLGGLAMFVAGCIIVVKYLVKMFEDVKKAHKEDRDNMEEKQQVFIDEMRKSDEMRINTYKEILESLRKDSKDREDSLILTLNNLTTTMDKAFGDFSKVLNVTNESMIEVSAQLGNLGSDFHRELNNISQRIGDVEKSMDRVNEKLAIKDKK